MTAVAYCMRDLHGSDKTPPGAVCVPQSSGGCGVPHEAKKTDAGRWVIECDLCAPRLVAKTYGFSSDAAGVPLSCDEIRSNELAERDGRAAQSTVMSAMTEAFVRQIQATGANFPGMTPPPAQKSLLEQLADMSPDERAQLGALLGGPAAPVAVDDKPSADLAPPKAPRSTPAARKPAAARTPRTTR